MRPWPEGWKTSLRHLSAARFFLPERLDQGDFPESEAQFNEYLHHTEFGLALEILEFLGEQNNGHAEEALFWSELMLAAENMHLPDHVERYHSRLAKASRDAGPGA